VRQAVPVHMPVCCSHRCLPCPLCCALEVFKGKHAAVLGRQPLTSIPGAAAEALQTPGGGGREGGRGGREGMKDRDEGGNGVGM